MNKEIKEMAEILLKASEKFYATKCDKECADYEALILHEAGYRKQSDTIKEFVEKLLENISHYIMKDFEDGVPYYGADCEQIDDKIKWLATEYGAEVE